MSAAARPKELSRSRGLTLLRLRRGRREYEQRLREARATLFRAQEARRKEALDARSVAMNEARTKAQAQVQAAKADIEKDRNAAQAGLQGQVQALAIEIMRRVLEPAGAGR